MANEAFKKVMTASFAVVVVMSPMRAGAVDGQVQYDDLRLESAGVVEAAGHAASGKNRIALMVKGGDKALLQKLYIAASQVEKDINRDVWFLHSVDSNSSDDKTEVDIYVSGRKTGTLFISSSQEYMANDLIVAGVHDGIRQTAK